jgi:hypothetical protein
MILFYMESQEVFSGKVFPTFHATIDVDLIVMDFVLLIRFE